MTAGIIAATALITATTIDDAVWLIPYCSSPQLPTYTKVIHGIAFILTLELLSVLCVLTAGVFKTFALRVGGSNTDSSFVLGLTSALICWIIAGFLFFKKMLKKRRRAMKAMAETSVGITEENSIIEKDEETPLIAEESLEDKVDIGEVIDDNSSSSDDSSVNERNIPNTPSIRMVLLLTFLGALDEISYFPALVLGDVFSAKELITGTFLAATIILIIVLFFLSRFKRLVDFLDSIPLYGIVGMFAFFLTLELFFE
mmetsp:Transcript_27786/g.41337  ORF Transcript_27786/g.41337 Transcript_27786/m.41337 type:complete len:257 (-) Transcript_27786:44-814(-)